MMDAVNLSGMCGKGDWPVAGGLMDQAAWFVAMKQQLDSELNRIDQERAENDA